MTQYEMPAGTPIMSFDSQRLLGYMQRGYVVEARAAQMSLSFWGYTPIDFRNERFEEGLEPAPINPQEVVFSVLHEAYPAIPVWIAGSSWSDDLVAEFPDQFRAPGAGASPPSRCGFCSTR